LQTWEQLSRSETVLMSLKHGWVSLQDKEK